MANLLLLAVCFALGALGRASRRLPQETPRVLNAWVLYVSLPALVLVVVPHVTLSPALLAASAAQWALAGLAALAALLAVRRGWAAAGVAGALALSCGFCNTSFVGLPLLEALGGAAAVGPGAVVDQAGAFLALSFIGVPLAVKLSGGHASAAALVRRVVLFPPFLALLAALALRWAPPLPGAVEEALRRLGAMLSPLALASVGFQLELGALAGQARRLALGLGFKLAVAPALVLLAFALHGPLGLVERVAVAQAAMAPMVTGGVLAAEHGLEPRLAAALVALGVPLSFLTVPLWWHLA